MKVSVIIVTRNTREMTLNCLDSLAEVLAAGRHEVIVVDNASSDGTAEAITARYPQVTVLREARNAGFSQANNHGAQVATGELILFLNSDTLASAAAVEAVAAVFAEEATLGAAIPQLVDAEGRSQLTVAHTPGPATLLSSAADDKAWARVAEAVARGEALGAGYYLSGAALMVRREVFAAVGGFDESFFLYYEDTDLCTQLTAQGWAMRLVAAATVVHLQGGSTSGGLRTAVEQARSRYQYLCKHHGRAGALTVAGVEVLATARRALFSTVKMLLTLGCWPKARRKAWLHSRLCLGFLLLPKRESRLYRVLFGDWYQ